MSALARLVEVQETLTLAEEAYRLAVQARDSFVTEIRAEGFTIRETASLLGISNQRVSQIQQAQWGKPVMTTPSERLATARAAFDAAKRAQALREERYTLGYRTERKAFYGDPSVAQADVTEDPVRWAGFHQAAAS